MTRLGKSKDFLCEGEQMLLIFAVKTRKKVRKWTLKELVNGNINPNQPVFSFLPNVITQCVVYCGSQYLGVETPFWISAKQHILIVSFS